MGGARPSPYHREVMATSWALHRSREAIERLSTARLPLAETLAEALPQLQRVIGFDAGGLGLNDPISNLPVEVVTDSPVFQAIEPRFWQIEFRVPDVNKYATLLRGPRRAGILSQATTKDLAYSARWAELLGPSGLGDELRAALVVDGACWGLLCLHREAGSGTFALDDRRWAAAVFTSLASAIRAAWTAGPWPSLSSDGPGTLVVSDTAQHLSWTPGAARWLDRLGHRGTTAIHALVARLGAPREEPSKGFPWSRTLVRSEDGTWVELHAECLSGPGGAVAITLQAAHPDSMARLLMAAHALSAREQDVARKVLKGLSTAKIAGELLISEYTVQDHLGAIFAKVGVRTRRQLMVRLSGGRPEGQELQPPPRQEG